MNDVKTILNLLKDGYLGGGGGSVSEWGDITGTLDNQLDLKNELDAMMIQIAPQWSTNTSYAKDSLIIYNRRLYICKEAHTSTAAWESNKWESTTIAAQLLQSGIIADELASILDGAY